MPTWLAVLCAIVGLVLLVLSWFVLASYTRVGWGLGLIGLLLFCLGVLTLAFRPSSVVVFSVPVLVVTLVLAVAAGVASWMLWQNHSNGSAASNANRANLAIALGGGAAVALALAAVQLFVGVVADRQQDALRDESDRQRILALREDFKFRISLTQDLTGFTPPLDPDQKKKGASISLSDVGLRRKILAGANFDGVDLRGADLAETDPSGATLNRTQLTKSAKSRTDLRAATLDGAVIRHSKLRGVNLTTADLRNSYLHDSDFSDALVGYVDLRETRCGENTDEWHACTPDELEAMGFPTFSERPATACWPGDRPDGARRWCGADARAFQDQRSGVDAASED